MPAICPNCGRAITPAAAFCPNCGVKTGTGEEEAAAVTATLVGFDALGPSISPDVLGELTEKFFAAADEIANDHGGTAVREDASGVSIKFPRGVPSPATTAASCALALRDATRGFLATLPKNLSGSVYLTVGVDAAPQIAEVAGENHPPRTKARRLRNKAGKWNILAGENVYAQTADDFRYAPVGFYQARGDKPAVKIYELKEDRRHPPSTPPMETTPYVAVAGLEEAVDNFLAAVVTKKQRRTLLVTGGAGTGKTTGLSVTCRMAREKGFQIYAASCAARRRYQPFGLWAPIWRAIFTELAPGVSAAKAPARALSKIDGRLEIWAPLFAHILGYRAELNPHVADVSPEFRHNQVSQITRDLIARVVAEKPTAIVLDDLQWADPSSRALLGSLLTGPDDAPLALVLSSEPPDESIGRAADSILAARPFTKNEVGAFAEDFGETGDQDPGAALYAASEGRPEILEQIWLLAREKSDIRIKSLAADGSLEATPLVARRLRDFDKRWQHATATLATMGIPLNDGDIRALAVDVFGPDGAAAESWRYKIYKLQLLKPSLGGAGEGLSCRPHLADAVLAAVASTAENRTAAAQTAAAFLAKRNPGESSARVTLELEAGNIAAAYNLAKENAKQARWLGSPHNAVDQLTAVINELEKGEIEDREKRTRQSYLFLSRAEAFREAGLVAAALSDLEKTDVTVRGLAARRFYTQGQVYQLRHYYQEAEKAFIEALQHAVRSNQSQFVAEIELALADLMCQQGDVAKATYELEKSLKAERASSAEAYRLLADLKYRAGYVADAVRAAKKSLSLTDTAQKPVTAAGTALSLAPLIFDRGLKPKARGLLANARETYDAVGDKKNKCRALLIEAGFDLATADLATSERAFGEALSLAEKESDPCAAEASLGLSAVLLLRGDVAGHRRLLVKAGEISDGETYPSVGNFKLVGAAGAYFADEDYDEAYLLAEAAAAAYRRAGDAFLYGGAAILAAWAALAGGKREVCREILRRTDLERRAREAGAFSAYYNLTVGELFATEGDPVRARKHFTAAAAAARELNLWLVRGRCYVDLAENAASDKDRDKYLRRAIWLFENKGADLLARKAKEKTGLSQTEG